MRRRSFKPLLGATIVLLGVAAFAVFTGDRAVVSTPRSERVFPELASQLGDLAWMRLSHGKTHIDFASIAGRWVLVEKGNYPAAPGKMRRLLLGLAELTIVEPKTARAELFGRLEVDDPSLGKSTEIALRDRTGKTVADLIAGKVRQDRLGGGSNGIYIRKPGDAKSGDNRAWLARGEVNLQDGILGWIDRRIVDLAPGRLDSVTFTGADGAVLTLRRDATGGKFAVADPPADTKFKPDAALSEPAAALAGLDLDDVKPATDLTVPDDGVPSAEFTTFDGLTVKVKLVSADGGDWMTIAASGSGKAENDAKEINDRVARWAYAIPAQRAKLLRTRLADLVEPAKGS